MKHLTVGQRLSITRTVLSVLLVVGVLLALWGEHIRSSSELRSERLVRNKDRVYFDFVEMSDSIRGLLLNAGDEVEARRWEDAEKSLEKNFVGIKAEYRDQPELLASVDDLRDFLITKLLPFHVRVKSLLQQDAAAAVEQYQKSYPILKQERSQRYLEFSQKVLNVVAIETDQAKGFGAIVGFGAIAFVAIASLIFWRSQSSALSEPLKQLVSGIEQMRSGDFSRRLELQREDEFGQLGKGFNRLADDLSGIVGHMQRAGAQVNSNAAQIASTSREQQVTAMEIASTISWIGTTSKDIATTSRQLSKTVSEVTGVAEETTRLASSGQTAINRMEATMRHIVDASSAISAKLAVLNDKTANINTVVTTITKVADQTNLLSLNAAIEAEKAGEYGLGFSVVANEIRRLADQTAVATYDIENMVKEMRSSVAAGVMGMDKFAEDVRRGVEEVQQVGVQLAQIIQQVQTLAPRFQTVNDGVQSQVTGAQEISETLVRLGESAQKTAESLRHSNAAIEQLHEAARGLHANVQGFKLKV